VEDTKPMPKIIQNEFFLKIFAARAGAEIEQRKAEKALIESEERFRLLTENSSDQILEICDGKLVYANKIYWDYVGNERATDPNHDPYLGFHPDDKEILKKMIEEYQDKDENQKSTFDEGLRFTFRVKSIIDDGWRWIDLKANFYDTASGERHGVLINRDITDIKQAEKAIAENEQMLSMIIDTAPAIIIYVDNNGIYKKLNDFAAWSSGSTVSKMIGKNYKQFFNEETNNFFDEKLTETKNEGRIMSYDYSLIVEGEKRYFTAAINPYFSNGEFLGYVIIAIDVTQNKMAEEALKENQLLLQRVIDTAPLNIIYLDNQYQYQMVNEQYCRSMGYSKEKLLGSNIKSVLPEDQFQNVKEKFEDIIESKRTLTFEYDMIISDKKKYFYAAMSPHFSSSNEFLGMVNIGFDITPIKEAQEALRISEERFRKLTQSAKDAIIIIDNHGKVTFWNEGAEKIFGFTSDEAINKDVHEMITPEHYLDDFRHGFSAFQESGSGPVVGILQELTAKRKDGSTFEAELSIASVQVKNNWHAIGIARDISERKLLENDLKIAKENAEAANKAKSEFLANMSHEIRTPMNAIIGFSELLLEKIENHQQRTFAEAISTSGSNLLNIINDILDLSKIEAGKVDLQYSTVDPQKLLNDIEKIFTLKVKEKGINYICIIDDDIPRSLVLDEIRLRQILVNLVGNAIKFTDSGYVKLTMEKGMVHNEDSIDLLIRVEDTGIGIADKDQKLIFESFRQQSSPNTKKYEGTGLGLAITKRLVEMMGGSISLQSEIGEGSVFTVELKNIAIADTEHDSSQHHEEFDDSIKFVNTKILLVDDIALNRELVKEYLLDRVEQIIEAENGQEAIEKANDSKPDLILMDMKMPVMDGYEATRKIKSNPVTANIPIIALTASAMKGDEIRIKEAGCETHLAKPVAKKALLKELMKHLNYELESEQSSRNIADNLENLSPEKDEITDIKRLIEKLEKEFNPRISKLRNNLIVGMINVLINDLFALAKEHNSSVIKDYADELKKTTDSFDLPAIRKILDYFPEIVDKFKNV
jgi:PAS domain S-box-containing protein